MLAAPATASDAIRIEGSASARYEGWQLNESSPWNPDNLLGRERRRVSWQLNLEGSLCFRHLQMTVSPMTIFDDSGEHDTQLREAYVTFDLGTAELTAGKGLRVHPNQRCQP